ncbi:inter-alpha-trypsin inhibitor heavy chain H3 isoform X3 [Amia ocellicauda]|uniref:inter-alpha-trypsin inhibitor heavy chain H3 isoform X3 n=1 Tax=Amia ocellicauda TaxID=2972642 RepID=UPI003463B2FD
MLCATLCVLLLIWAPVAPGPSTPWKRDTGQQSSSSDVDIYSFHIDSRVSSRYAHTVITSRVANRADQSREVLFEVELPKNAFISNFSMTVGGKTYVGEVKEKEVARQQYDKAVSRGETAGLVSTVGRTMEEFKTSVTVAAHSKVTFELTYEELLKRRHGQYELLVKARPKQVVSNFTISVRIYEPQGISSLEAQGALTTNELSSVVQTTLTEKTAHVLFSPSEEQQRLCKDCGDRGLSGDLIIKYDVSRELPGELQVVNGYFVHYFAPTIDLRIPKSVVFVIDRSGSMSGSKIIQTHEALLQILGDINEQDHFGLISFDSSVSLWKETLVKASPGNLEEARAFVKSITARGATDINEAVMQGAQLLSRAREDKSIPEFSASILILLTDGDPTSGVTNLDQIQANVRQAIQKKHTLYCLGFGFDVNYKFLEKMALENGGVARRIYTHSDAALQLKGFYEEVATPLLLEVEVLFLHQGVANLTRSSFSQYYNGSEIVVAGRLLDNSLDTLVSEVQAQSSNAKEMFRLEAPVAPETGFQDEQYIFGQYIERLWAYLTVQQLLERELLVSDQEKAQVRGRALELSIQYNFVTPLTSMVVTKPEDGQSSGPQVAEKPKEEQDLEETNRDMSFTKSSGHRRFHHRMPQGPQGPLGSGSDTGSKRAVRKKLAGRGGHSNTGYVRANFPLPDSEYHLYSGPRPFPDPRILDHPPVLATVVPSPEPPLSVRFLVPSKVQVLPLCFDMPVSPGQTLLLFQEPTTGLAIFAEVGAQSRGSFSRIKIQISPSVVIRASALEVTLLHTATVQTWPWPDVSYTSDSLSVSVAGRVLTVTTGDSSVEVLVHQLQSRTHLWARVKDHAYSSGTGGLIGQFQDNISYEVKDSSSRSARIEVRGNVLDATSARSVDYSTLSRQKVDCWLVPPTGLLRDPAAYVSASL